jgi:hypothetical protein
MNISIIVDSLVLPDKTLLGNEVSDSVQIDDLNDLAYVATNFHFAPATFHNTPYKSEWLTDKNKNWKVGKIGRWKNLKNIEQIQFLSFDFDDGTISSAQIHIQLKDINHLILSSKSHMVDKQDGRGIIERFHVFIPLDRPITDGELYKFSCKNFAESRKWPVDQAVIEGSRYFFKHTNVLYIENNKCVKYLWGFEELLKANKQREEFWKKQNIKKQQSESSPRENNYSQIGSPLEKFQSTKTYKSLLNGSLSMDGDRYNNSSKTLGVMVKCGLKYKEIMELFDKYSNYGSNFTRESVERRLNAWA